jgi:predicted ester cyclase
MKNDPTNEDDPNVSRHGVPGFHHRKENGREMASMELDTTGEEGRVNTGTGDQPGNTHQDRFATPNADPADDGVGAGTIDQNRTVVLRFVHEILEMGDHSAPDRLLTPDFRSHTWAADGLDADGLHEAMRRIARALADVRMTIEDVIAENDKVVVRLTAQATQVGELMGLLATNRRYAITEIHIFRLAEGRIAEHWHAADMLGMMRQLSATRAEPGL